MQELTKVGPNSLGETMVANLLDHKGRTTRSFPAQWAFGTICAAVVPTRGLDDPRTPRPAPFWPRWRKAAAARNTFKGLRGGTSSGQSVLMPFDPLEQLNGALARANPQKAEPRSCMVLGLKPMGKLITLDKYLSVRQN